ncbi:MAG: nitrate reductase molybdenum cofactor assembly chaperone [Burkholderiaceae bacterium]|jgi:nitrate reductase delta subunit
MKLYKILSALLCYPQAEMLAGIPEIRALLADEYADFVPALTPLLDEMAHTDLIHLQERYVQTFDRTPSHSLHLFEHVHGEDRARGQAMVDLLDEYRKHGFDVMADELPDYVPLFLEFLSECTPSEAQTLLGEAVHVLAHIGHKLKGNESLYASVFEVLVARSPVVPEPLTVPPIRDMDEAMETFGPNAEGVEPLLNQRMATPAVAPINFYAQRPQ